MLPRTVIVAVLLSLLATSGDCRGRKKKNVPPPTAQSGQKTPIAQKERELKTARGDTRRSLLFNLGKDYLELCDANLRDAKNEEALPQLEKAGKHLKQLWKDTGNAPEKMMMHLAKIHGLASRRQKRFTDASEAYGYIVDKYLDWIANPRKSNCADPASLNFNSKTPYPGDKDQCVTANSLRYYGNILVIIERAIPDFEKAQRSFNKLAKLKQVGWTDSWQVPVNFQPDLSPALPIWVRSLPPDAGEPFHPTVPDAYRGSFDILRVLEEHADGIKDDLQILLRDQPNLFINDPTTDEHLLVDIGTGTWNQVPLIPLGMALEDLQPEAAGCILAPSVCKAFRENFELLQTDIGQRDGKKVPASVSFARLEPGTHMIAHTGPSNRRLTIHLPLIVPHGPTMRVATENLTWTEKKTLMFDDSFEHEVWHEGSEPRYILHTNIWHPSHTKDSGWNDLGAFGAVD